MKRWSARVTEKWIMRQLEKIARKYLKMRYPEGYKGQHAYMSFCIIADRDTLYLQGNNEYKGVNEGRDAEYPIDAHKQVKVGIKSTDA